VGGGSGRSTRCGTAGLRPTSLAALILATLVVACSKGEAHDLGKWAGVPWALSGAVLPDDRHSIIDWFAPNIAPKFRHFQTYDHTVFGFVSRSGFQGELTARAVVPDPDGWYPGPNNIVGTRCRRPCTPRDILAAVAKSEEWTTMIEYLDAEAPLNLVGVAVDTHNEFGFTTDSDAYLFFAQPGGGWVFLISAPTPADLQTITNVLVDRLAS
jgi:hypothetical protein